MVVVLSEGAERKGDMERVRMSVSDDVTKGLNAKCYNSIEIL